MRTFVIVCTALTVIAVGCSPNLEEGEVLEKKGDTFTIRLAKKIDEPLERVWEGLQTPEQLERYSEQYQQTKLVKAEGNTKVIDFRVQALGQLQAFTMQLTAFPADKRIALKTLDSSLADVDGEYTLTPADDGEATIITYKAVQKDKVHIPAPVSVQKTAIKELFENLVAGVKKLVVALGAPHA